MQETVKIICLTVFGLLILFAVAINSYISYQQGEANRAALLEVTQSIQDGNHSVVRELQMRQRLQEESYHERQIIEDVKDDCLDKPVPERIVRVLVAVPTSDSSKE